MASEQETELAHQLEIRAALRERLYVLDVQLAQMGRLTPAHIKTEREEARRQIEAIDQRLKPPEAPLFLDRMSAEEQRRYLISLVMQLQADFVESWHLLLVRVRWFIVGLIIVELLRVVIEAWR